MNLSQHEARVILRLPSEGPLDPSLIESAFQKQVRRYPLEQFPDKFALLRKSYAILTDQSLLIQDLLSNTTFDLSFLVESYEPMNPKAQTATEVFIFESLSAIMRENCREILEETEVFDDDEVDLPDFADDEYLYDFLDDLVKSSLRKSAAKKKKQ
jgi:hypothetical protein